MRFYINLSLYICWNFLHIWRILVVATRYIKNRHWNGMKILEESMFFFSLSLATFHCRSMSWRLCNYLIFKYNKKIVIPIFFIFFPNSESVVRVWLIKLYSTIGKSSRKQFLIAVTNFAVYFRNADVWLSNLYAV